jgi:hypothetical protein
VAVSAAVRPRTPEMACAVYHARSRNSSSKFRSVLQACADVKASRRRFPQQLFSRIGIIAKPRAQALAAAARRRRLAA